jgi:uncharacterized zinc-type alcohol dehydrogenase-like protein
MSTSGPTAPDAVAVAVRTPPPPSPIDTLCLACDGPACAFSVLPMQRRALGDRDVLVDVKYCGVCHSDVHTAAGHMAGITGPVQYPMVPGHELAGVVAAVGAGVTAFAVGDRVGVGCLVDACLSCARCVSGEEQKCKRGNVATYGGKDAHGRAAQVPEGRQTLGGYAERFVVDERFAVRVPPALPLEAAGPVCCAGITMYDPMRVAGVGPGSRVGIVGLGGLGQMGVKIAAALGCEVTAISRGVAKRAFALERGAAAFVDATSDASLADAAGTLDLILNTVPVYHDYLRFQALLRPRRERRGLSGAGPPRQVLLGLHVGLGGAFVAGSAVGAARSRVASSGIGGIRATQEVMDLCASRGIAPDVEVVGAGEMHRVYETLDAGNDAGKRFVLDVASLREDAAETRAKLGPPPKLQRVRRGFTPWRVLGEALRLLCFGHWWR